MVTHYLASCKQAVTFTHISLDSSDYRVCVFVCMLVILHDDQHSISASLIYGP